MAEVDRNVQENRLQGNKQGTAINKQIQLINQRTEWIKLIKKMLSTYTFVPEVLLVLNS